VSLSPLVPNVRGLNQALDFIENEGMIPMFVVCVDRKTNTLTPLVLDASEMEQDEEVRVMLMAAMMRSVAAKLRG
jgi:hypothetical protein